MKNYFQKKTQIHKVAFVLKTKMYSMCFVPNQTKLEAVGSVEIFVLFYKWDDFLKFNIVPSERMVWAKLGILTLDKDEK